MGKSSTDMVKLEAKDSLNKQIDLANIKMPNFSTFKIAKKSPVNDGKSNYIS